MIIMSKIEVIWRLRQYLNMFSVILYHVVIPVSVLLWFHYWSFIFIILCEEVLYVCYSTSCLYLQSFKLGLLRWIISAQSMFVRFLFKYSNHTELPSWSLSTSKLNKSSNSIVFWFSITVSAMSKLFNNDIGPLKDLKSKLILIYCNISKFTGMKLTEIVKWYFYRTLLSCNKKHKIVKKNFREILP